MTLKFSIAAACLGFALWAPHAATSASQQKMSSTYNQAAPLDGDSLLLCFGSCSNQDKVDQQLWTEIAASKPDLFIWLGDIVYPKTYTFHMLKAAYNKQKSHPGYQALLKQTKVVGVWDDHDYGLNDGGVENTMKQDVKKLLLQFLGVDAQDERWSRDGVYTAYDLAGGSVKLILLDTRWFRDKLTKSEVPGERYVAQDSGTVLGTAQWAWFETQLAQNKADVTIIVSSIQLLNDEHKYEKWGNMPHEKRRFEALLAQYPQSEFMVLSGDRHFTEISAKTLAPNSPEAKVLHEFTSSGITQVYTGSAEPNRLRISPFIKEPSFGTLSLKKVNGRWAISQATVQTFNNKLVYQHVFRH